MKTVLQVLIEDLTKLEKFINDDDSEQDRYYRSGLREAIKLAKEKLPEEKDQTTHYGALCCAMTAQKNEWTLDGLFNETFNKTTE